MGFALRLPFIGQAYENRAIQVSNQKCINWYPEIESDNSRNVITLQSVSGSREFANVSLNPDDAIRGMVFAVADNKLYFVAGSTLYSSDSSGVTTSLGNIDGSGLVSMAENSNAQIAIATGSSYWVYDSSGLDKITDAGRVSDLAFQDGYIALIETNSDVFKITSDTDARVINPVDFVATGANPDKLVGIVQSERRLWLFGSNSIEIFYNSGAAAFPFTRVDGGSSNGFGLAGKDAKIVQDSVVYWLSNDGRIYLSNGYTPQRISHYGVENSIRKYSDISDCECSQWTENGHKFIAFSFPTGNQTWVFDATSAMWHERSSGVVGDGDVWRSRLNTRAWGKNLVGDRLSGVVGELDLELFTEYGNLMKAKRTSPVVHAEQKEFFTDRLEFLMESGFTDEQNFEPTVNLRWSDDGGVTFGNWIKENLGKIGEYQERVVFRMLGQSVNRVYDLEITSDVRRILIDCDVVGEVGDV